MRFTRKSIAIEADQWFPGKSVTGVHDPLPGSDRHYVIVAANQMALVEPGDWIVQKPDGSGFYPCKPSVFESRYERAAERHKQEADVDDELDQIRRVINDCRRRCSDEKCKAMIKANKHEDASNRQQSINERLANDLTGAVDSLVRVIATLNKDR